MSARKIRTILKGLLTTLYTLYAGAASAGYTQLNMPQGVTAISREVYDLHMLILWICVVIGIVVFGAMFWSIFYHRKSRGAQAQQFHHNTAVEIVWTIIPVIILVAMAVPATKTLQKMEDTSAADMTIKITGYQWRWRYDYVDEGFGFFSSLASDSNEIRQLRSGMDPKEADEYLLNVDNPIVVPVGLKIRFLMTAADVIHSWWVPDLGWKRDAIPGFINESWAVIEEEGVYRGQCAELCGKDHAFMPVVLKAVSEDEYYDWVGEQLAMQDEAAAGADREWSMDELMEKGEEVYGSVCVACHQANGQGVPGAFPALDGGAITTGPVEEHIDIVLNGKAGTAMAAFGPQLNDVDLAAVITYERNAWGNDAGDTVQPADIKAMR